MYPGSPGGGRKQQGYVAQPEYSAPPQGFAPDQYGYTAAAPPVYPQQYPQQYPHQQQPYPQQQYAQQPGAYGYGAPPPMQYNNQYVQPPPSGYNYNQPHAPAGYGWSGMEHQKPTTGGGGGPGGAYYDEEAGAVAPKPTFNQPGAYVTSSEDMIRKGFLRKVYTILLAQIVATIVVSVFFMYNEPARTFVLTTPALMFVGLGLSLVTLFALICYRHKYPLNMGLLTVWTLVESYTVGVVCASYSAQGAGDIVLQAFIITGVIFFGLTLFTLQSKINFSFMGAFLGVALMAMFAWGIIVWILGMRTGFIFSLLGAIIFSLYIIYDTWMLSATMSPDDYILGAITIYLDVINLFLCLLRLLGDRRD